METVTDWANRVTWLTHDANSRLTTATLPDPDGGGAETSPVVTLGYSATTGLLDAFTDPNLNTTQYVTDFSRRIKEIIAPDGGKLKVAPVLWQTLPDTAAGEGTPSSPWALADPSEVEGSTTNALNKQSFLKTNAYATPTMRRTPQGDEFFQTVNSRNQVTQRTLADPDGAGPAGSSVWNMILYGVRPRQHRRSRQRLGRLYP